MALAALADASTYIASFVASLYVFPASRTADDATRDAPRVVMQRCTCILGLSLLTVPYAASRYYGRDVKGSQLRMWMLLGTATVTPASWTGVAVECTRLSLRGLAITATLFAGPLTLAACEVARSVVLDASRRNPVGVTGWGAGLGASAARHFSAAAVAFVTEWTAPQVRNLIAAPIAEEVVLRYLPLMALEHAAFVDSGSASGPYAVLATAFVPTRALGVSAPWLVACPWRRVVLSALFFYSAHIHHGVRYYKTNLALLLLRGRPMQEARARARQAMFARMTGDFIVTTTFGLLGAALLRAGGGSILVPFASHALCNAVGAPSLQYLWEDRTVWIPSTNEGGRGAISPKIVTAERWLISAAYVAGIAGFFYRLS